MKPLTIQLGQLDDFARVAKAQEGLVFIEVGAFFDTLFFLPNKQYPLVYEYTVAHDGWKHMERDLRPVPASIEGENE